MEDAKKEVQAMKRHAKRQSGLMDSRASNDSADQVTTYYFGIKCSLCHEFNMKIPMLHLYFFISLVIFRLALNPNYCQKDF